MASEYGTEPVVPSNSHRTYVYRGAIGRTQGGSSTANGLTQPSIHERTAACGDCTHHRTLNSRQMIERTGNTGLRLHSLLPHSYAGDSMKRQRRRRLCELNGGSAERLLYVFLQVVARTNLGELWVATCRCVRVYFGVHSNLGLVVGSSL